MDFLEMTPEQLKEVIALPSRDEMVAYLEKEGITLPEKVPYNWVPETEKFTRKLWKMIKFPEREVCAEEDHDWQLSGRNEMERNSATGTGACFRKEFRCTKCEATKWKADKEPEPVVVEAAGAAGAGAADDRAAARAARKAAREAARAAKATE